MHAQPFLLWATTGLEEKAARRRAQDARWEPAATLGIKKARRSEPADNFD